MKIEHGGARVAELRGLGLQPDEVIDFSASVNPYGPSPRVQAALRRSPLGRYPDPECTLLVEALARNLELPPDWILPGNGATELLRAAAFAWSGPKQTIAMLEPSFGEYQAAARAVGARVVRLPLDTEFRLDLDEAERAIAASGPSLIYLCNPNNPTGTSFSQHEIERLLPSSGTATVVLDEAFIGFVAQAWDVRPLLARYPNLVVVRSMTKDYALTALRLGYALGQPRILKSLRRLLPPWNVNGLAQTAGVAALDDPGHLQRSLERLARAKAILLGGLTRIGLALHAGAANFVLVNVGDGRAVRADLLRHGLLVRDCASFRLPAYIRVAVRRPAECRRLCAALAEALRESRPRAPLSGS